MVRCCSDDDLDATMTSSNILFERAVIASLLAFALLGTAYFRLVGQRTWIAAIRFAPFVGLASVGVPIAFEVPLVAKVLFWLLGSATIVVCLLAVVASRSLRSAMKGKTR